MQGRGTRSECTREKRMEKLNYVGVDVSAKTITMIIDQQGKRTEPLDLPNDARGHDGRKRSFRVMPHSAFHGQTPNEMFFGTGDEVTRKLSAAHRSAREERMRANRTAQCGVCVREASSGALLLQRARSRMS